VTDCGKLHPNGHTDTFIPSPRRTSRVVANKWHVYLAIWIEWVQRLHDEGWSFPQAPPSLRKGALRRARKSLASIWMKRRSLRPTGLNIYGESPKELYSGTNFGSSVLPPYAIGNSLKSRDWFTPGTGLSPPERLGPQRRGAAASRQPARILTWRWRRERKARWTCLRPRQHGQYCASARRETADCAGIQQVAKHTGLSRLLEWDGVHNRHGYPIMEWALSNACCRASPWWQYAERRRGHLVHSLMLLPGTERDPVARSDGAT